MFLTLFAFHGDKLEKDTFEIKTDSLEGEVLLKFYVGSNIIKFSVNLDKLLKIPILKILLQLRPAH